MLDDIFPRDGPPPELPERKTGEELLASALQGGTRWHCEERIRLTLDAFFECWPYLLPRSYPLRQQHYAAARVIVDEVGELEAPAFVRWARTVIVGEFPLLTIKSCRSLVFLLERWREREAYAKKYEPCPECGALLGHGRDCPRGEELPE